MKILIFTALFLVFAGLVSAQKNGTMSVKLYFGNEKRNPNMENCSRVFPVTRRLPKTKAVAKSALEELFKGVTAEETARGFHSFSPAATRGILKSIRIKNKIAYLNFNKAVYEQLGTATTSCGGSFFFSSLEKTLLQFPTIKKVFYAVEGSPRDFYEWVQVGECPPELKNCSGRDFK